MCRWRICGNHYKPCFVFPHFIIFSGPTVKCQTILTNFRSLHFFIFPEHYTYSTRKEKNTSHKNCHLRPLTYFLQRCLTTSTVLFLSTFRGRAGGTPFYPSQHVVLLPQVYSLFRPGHKSWIWLATQRCGMTSDRSGARRSASSGGWIQSENCVDHKPANLECQN